MSARYALFFCPDDVSALAGFGQQALKRTASGQSVPASIQDFPDTNVARRLRATPAFYGFHATLKAPFSLRKEFSETRFLAAVETFACQQALVPLHALYPRELASFVGLTLEPRSVALDEFAARCVESFEHFREPLAEADIERRNPEKLGDLQRDYLYRYGYPYVLSEFRFHMTLTGKLELASDADYTRWLQALFEEMVPETPILDRIAVCQQPDRDTPFVRIAQFCLSDTV